MLHGWKRIVVAVLTALLLFDASPIPAMASVLSNAPAENEQILSELGSIAGSEDEAERYYELMERYGLLDEDRNPVESWTIQMDGKDVTLDEIRATLAGDYDAAKTVTVDGTPVTLGDLDTMLQIEDYVAHVKDTYFSDQEWTDEQKASLESLENQINSEGIEILGTEGELTFPSGVDHNLRLKVEAEDTAENGQDYTVTVSTADGQPVKKEVTFDYVALSGSVTAEGSGTAAIPVDQSSTTVTVKVGSAAGSTNGDSVFVLSLFNVKNALFEGDATAWNKTVKVKQQFDKVYIKTETVRFGSFEGDGQGLVAFNNSEGATTHNLNYGNQEIYDLMTNNQYKSVSASLPDLSSALYPGQYEISLVMPSLSVAADQQGLLFRDMVGSELYDMTSYFNPDECAAILQQTFGSVVDDPFYYLRIRQAFEKNPSGSRFSYAGGHMRVLLQREDDGNVQSQEMWQGTVPELTTQEYDPDNPPSGGQLTVDGSIGGTESSKTSVVMEMQASRYNIYDEDETNGYRLTVQYSMLPSTVNVRADVTYREATEQTTARFTVPSGSFYPGQQVPISVDLGFPIEITDDMVLSCDNGKKLVPVEIGSTSSVATYLYTVDSADGSSIVVNGGGKTLGGRGANERDITVTLPDQTEINDSLSAAQLITPDKREALESISAIVNEPVDNPVVHVSVATNPNEKMTAWLVAELSDNQSADGQYGTASSLTVAVDGGEPVALTAPLNLADGEPLVLSADVAIDRNITDSDVTHYIELYIDGSIAVGFGCTAIQEPVVFITEEDLSPVISVKDAEGKDYVFADDTHTIYAQDAPKIKASIGLAQGKDFSFGDTSNATTFTKNDDGTFVFVDPDADFAWRSTAPDVAAIDKDGNITPTGTGTASFELVALNGSVEVGGVSQMVTKTASYTFTSGGGEQQTLEALNFGAGLTPFLLIPNDELTAVDGQGVTVYWSSNLCDKNGDEPTSFTVEVKNEKGEAIEVPEGAEGVFNPMTVTGTASEPAASATIPAALLKYSYDEGASNEFTVEVKASYQNEEYSDTATISLASRPAVVDLASLPSYYILDTQRSQQLSWTIEHFDRADDNLDDVFKFQLTKNDEEVDTEDVVLSRNGGTATGGHTIDLGDVQANPGDPTSYRDVYTVTVQAKNGTDSTWSYDSFILYVYDAEALQILVDGKAKDGTLVMSNREVISQMSQEDILAFNRDISLKNAISINYGEYAWQELADQIAWASSNSSVASVNYQQGTLYENIENFAYTSYRPTEDFVLSGLSDGEVSVTATHKLTGMEDLLDVKVETLTDKLYLFQCYPQATTTLSFDIYTDAEHSATEHVTITSEGDGRAAYYAEHGIASDVYCTSTGDDGYTYLGTFYQAALKSGEQDSTKLELYPVNNLQMRRAAYAYVYLKNPNGTPYKGSITFRGGVYVNDKYVEGAQFKLNGAGDVTTPGNQDTTVELSDTSGKLEVTMDQTQWGLEEGAVTAGDKVEYVFQIEMDGGTDYLPMMLQINGTTNEHAVVGSGETVATFRQNEEQGKHPFIMYQVGVYGANGAPRDVLDYTGKIGPTDDFTEASLTAMVMWWGEEASADEATVALSTADNAVVGASSQHHRLSNTAYPFSDALITEYTVQLNQESLDGVIRSGAATSARLNYYRDGENLVRSEELPFKLCNLVGVGRVEDQTVITDMLHDMGSFAGTNAENDGSMSGGDEFVGVLLNLVATDDYTTGDDKLFSIQLAPTDDPTKFLGFIEANVGNMSDVDQVTGVYGNTGSTEDFDYTPGISEMMMLSGMRTPQQYAFSQMDDYNKSMLHRGVRNLSFDIGGYAETLIYYNENTGKWSIQILNGGFNAGGGMSYTWNYNTMCGPIPFTASLTAGGTAEVSMDALTVSYLNATNFEYDFGNDFLTQLRIYLYLRFFAGVGFDYSIVAFKLGVFGQVDLDMQFQWLNRPYMDSTDRIINAADAHANRDENGVEQDYNLDGQHFEITGQVGLEFIMKLLFISYEKVLFSYSFNLLDESTGDWEQIQTSWAANSAAQRKAIEDLLGNGSATLSDVGGQQMVSLNLAPTVESRDYLSQGDRTWNGGGIQLFSLDKENGLEDLETNSYPYANPVVTDDGELLAYVTDRDSINAEDTRVAWATKSGDSYTKGGELPTPKGEDGGYGDSQLSLGGVSNGAVAAWTCQTVSVAKDEGATLTDEDQMIMMNGTDVYASVWDGSSWTTTRLSDNSSPDMAPVVATNGKTGNGLRAVVAWRSVQSSGREVNADGTMMTNPTDFDLKDTIVYKVYENGKWSEAEAETLYNGTSGSVKGIVAAMLEDGTAAVAYTLDKGAAPEGISTMSTGGDATADDREIAYGVIDAEGEVVRSVIATNDAYLDENPQIAAVTFPDAGEDGKGAERFVLGWYSEQGASSDGAQALDGGTGETQGDATSDIRLLDFDANGAATQLLPDSLGDVAADIDVSITSNFRFTKNAETINDLSILWVERAAGELGGTSGSEGASGDDGSKPVAGAERDVLKGVKFYAYGADNELVRTTGAIDVAEMGGGTLIDHFDAYVSDSTNNTVRAVILGTTYGEGGKTVTRTAETVAGDTVSFTVPQSESGMYTATESYADGIEVPGFVADYETVRLGATTQIQFTIKNMGIHAINKLTIKVGDIETTYGDGSDASRINLLPGQTIQLAANYRVPENGVIDPDFTVTATFDEGSGAAGKAGGNDTSIMGAVARTFSGEASYNEAKGTVYLDLPDVEVTDASIVSEKEGKRTIQIKLNNHADAALVNSGRQVKLGFYSDAACETPLAAKYFSSGDIEDSSDAAYVVTVDDNANLAMVDDGGYAVQVTFDAAQFAKDAKGDDAAEVEEIPDTGIPVYARVWVEDTADAEPQELGDPVPSNNYGNVTAENLAVRTGEEVSINSAMTVDDAGTTVTVDLQNNRLAQKTTGNLIVTLLDADGKVIAQQQSYKQGTEEGEGNGLITLGGEGVETRTFTFEGVTNAAEVRVTYSDAVLDKDNARLASVSVDGVALTYDEATKTWTGSGDNLPQSLVTIVPENLDATVTVNGKPYSAYLQSFSRGENRFEIVVTAPDGMTTGTYYLVIANNVPLPAPTGNPVTVAEGNGHGTVEVDPERAREGQTVTVTPAPDEGYAVESVTVTTEDGTEVPVTEGEDGIWTFTMPAGPVTVEVGFHCLGGEACPTRPFGDVPVDAWYHDTMDWAVEEGLLTGYEDGTIGPDNTLSRSQLVTMLWRRAGSPETDAELTFTDCDPDAFYAEAVAWAASEGIVMGYGDGSSFGPEDPVTREQLAVIFWRQAGEPEASTDLSAFTDGSSASAYAVPALKWAVETSLLFGFSDGTLAPGGALSRAQTAAMFMRQAEAESEGAEE
ncbi:MAG TPA: S-layer homology domain-containing protein [Candidatus Limicola stercorigallinarum]|nr:S-layer homology domain-containing protein [Candidatus Limicola stercorigallinarum]